MTIEEDTRQNVLTHIEASLERLRIQADAIGDALLAYLIDVAMAEAGSALSGASTQK